MSFSDASTQFGLNPNSKCEEWRKVKYEHVPFDTIFLHIEDYFEISLTTTIFERCVLTCSKLLSNNIESKC